MNNPKVSVIVPVYNSADFLGACLDSLCSQTFKDIEIICINDGSSDHSGQVLKKYAERDPRITALTTENHGPGAARNKGIELSRGEYIFFIDSDDVLHRDALSKFVSIADQSSADIVCARFKRVIEPALTDEENLTGDFKMVENPISCFTHHPTKTPITVWNKLFKREIFKERRFISDAYYEDVPFTLSAFSGAKSCALTRDKTYLYRNGNPSIMRSKMTLRKIDDYAKACLFVYQDFRKRKMMTELNLLFQNYFSRLNKMILQSFCNTPPFRKYFWDKMSFLIKAGLVPRPPENAVKITRQAQPVNAEANRENQKD